jgi:hypothetical protein
MACLLAVSGVEAVPAGAATGKWSVEKTPRLGANVGTSLGSVSCVSVSDCVAVGGYADSGQDEYAMAEAWNGTSWTAQKVPRPQGTRGGSDLSGVSCPSTTLCVAVGSYSPAPFEPKSMAQIWNASTWRIQSVPDPPGATESNLLSLSCPSATMCMAVGYFEPAKRVPPTDMFLLADSWNGTDWTLQKVPQPTGGRGGVLEDVSCSSAVLCMAVGDYIDTAKKSLPLAAFSELWNGTSWQIENTPEPTDAKSPTDLIGVSCTPDGDCVTAGAYQVSENEGLPLTETWNGKTWTIHVSPTPSGQVSGATLDGIWCVSLNDCTAVGTYDTTEAETPWADAWNGTSWTLETTPQPPHGAGGLAGVFCFSATWCTAVGAYVGVENGNEIILSLIESES